MRLEDFIILGIIIIIVIIVINSKRNVLNNNSEPPKGGAALNLLQNNGYEVIQGKVRVPIDINTNERNYQSRIIVDYIAQKNGKSYIVKIKNKRKQERISGSFLRDELLAMQLMCRADGSLYIDLDKERIYDIDFVYTPVNFNRTLLDYLKLPKWVLVSAIALILFIILR